MACLVLPTENISFRQVFAPKPAEQVQQLCTMVHAVRDGVSDRAPIRPFGRRVVHCIDQLLIPPTALGDTSGYCCQVGSGPIKSGSQSGQGAAVGSFVLPHRVACHEIGPHLDVSDDVRERSPHSPVPNVEVAIKLLVCESPATQEQLIRRPDVMPQQTIYQIHKSHRGAAERRIEKATVGTYTSFISERFFKNYGFSAT